MNPAIVFDITTRHVPREDLVWAMVAWALCGVVAIFHGRPWFRRVAHPRIWIILAAFGTFDTASYWFDVKKLQHAIKRTESDGIVVSGVVEDFSPEPYSGHAHEEHFRVKSHMFRYSYYHDTPYFNSTSAHGGPLQNGLNVRIIAVGEHIARLKICDGASATSSAQ
jgi:hypothetical protein